MRLDRERRTNLTRKTTTARKPAAKTAARKAAPAKKSAPKKKAPAPETTLLSRILQSLNDDKAEGIVTVDLEGRSSLCDTIVIANGRSSRHVASIAEHLARRLKEVGYGTRPVNGLAQGDWALVDAGDVIVHVFRPEVRAYYDLEGMWSVDEKPVRARRAVR
ncbi:MAG: ribosome silencing factor [Rhizomicrobium sp.]